MTIKADLHCHTVASTHAYSTIMEIASCAKEKGLSAVAITDHGIAMPDSPHIWHFFGLALDCPKHIYGVTILPGVEANITDYNGSIDMPDEIVKDLSWVIASMHTPVLKPSTVDDHTRAWISVAKNPYIDMIGHCGQDSYRFDYEKAIKAFKEYDKIVEINNHSAVIRTDSAKNCKEIALACKKYGVPVCVNSDAHIAVDIGNVGFAMQMLEEINFPNDLILNCEPERVFELINKRRGKNYSL